MASSDSVINGIDLDCDDQELLSLSELRKLKSAVDRSVRMLEQYCDTGAANPSGPERIRLEHVKIGGTIYTTKQAWFRFIKRCTLAGMER